MNFSDLVPSLIRTYVPLIVAALATFLGDIGILLPEDASTGLATFLGALLSAAYYLGVRLAERKWPQLGLLLGSKKQPVMTKPENVVELKAVNKRIEQIEEAV